MRTEINKASIDKLLAGEIDGGAISDDDITGFQAQLLPSGKITYRFRYTNKGGKRCTCPLGMHPAITPKQARDLARKHYVEVKGGNDVAAARVEERKKTKAEANAVTVNSVLDQHVEQHVKKLKSSYEVIRCFDTYVRPAIGDLRIHEVKRGDINVMLNGIAKRSLGKVGRFNRKKASAEVQADRVLSYLSTAFTWYAPRDPEEKFASPIIKGMKRTKPSKRVRKRILDNQEIRDLYCALDELEADKLVPPCFPPFLRMLLLTATRRTMVSAMRRDEIVGPCWTIPADAAKRSKGGEDHQVILTDTMLALIDTGSAPFVFSTTGGKKAFRSFGKAKAALDLKINEIRARDGREPMKPWVFHDLRRTARTILERLGHDRFASERVLSHKMGGVLGTYNLHGYDVERMEALQKLDAEIKRILREGSATVVPLPFNKEWVRYPNRAAS